MNIVSHSRNARKFGYGSRQLGLEISHLQIIGDGFVLAHNFGDIIKIRYY